MYIVNFVKYSIHKMTKKDFSIKKKKNHLTAGKDFINQAKILDELNISILYL